jgi:hypothetical protein
MATEKKKITVLEVRKLLSLSADRRGKYDTRVRYAVDGVPTGTVTIPSEKPTGEQIQAAVKEDLTEKAKLLKLSFEV